MNHFLDTIWSYLVPNAICVYLFLVFKQYILCLIHSEKQYNCTDISFGFIRPNLDIKNVVLVDARA